MSKETEKCYLLKEETSSLALGIMQELVCAVPESWRSVRGRMTATTAMKREGLALSDAGYLIGRRYELKVVKPDLSPASSEDVRSVIHRYERAGFVHFDETGQYAMGNDFALAKKSVHDFLNEGYRGWVHFTTGYDRGEHFCATAWCKMYFEPWDWMGGTRVRPEKQQPACMFLGLNTAFGGTASLYESVVAICRGFGMESFIPEREAPRDA